MSQKKSLNEVNKSNIIKSNNPEESSINLFIKQVYFDEILSGSKKKEYRTIKDTTASKYLRNERENGKLLLYYNPDLISEEKFHEYPNDIMYYNDGVFPYMPKDIKYLDLKVGYQTDRESMTVEVVDISFQPAMDKDGNVMRLHYDNETHNFSKSTNGDLTNWDIVFHLGEVVKVNGKFTL